MNPLLATVSIEHGVGPAICVRFAFPATGETVDFQLSDRRPLEAMRARAGMYLEDVAGRAKTLNATWDEADTMLRMLRNHGWNLCRILSPDRPDRIMALQAAFRQAWPIWSATWSDTPAVTPLVELQAFPDSIPIEMLPVFDFGDSAPARTYDDLARAASRFLGFTAVVRRVTSAQLPVDRVLRNHPALPVQFIRHRGLADAAKEEQNLRSWGDHVAVDGPWPTTQNDDEVLEALSRALFDGAGLDGGDASDPPVQVHHFACHCDTTAAFEDGYRLVFSTQSGRERAVTYAQLEEAHGKRLARDPRWRERSIILMNACGSSTTSPLTAASFPRWFLAYGHRAFIGTEARVPDDVAHGFSTAFYGRLLERRRPLGEAILAARRDLLRDYRNPLGLLYVVYGDTDVTVEHARPGIYRAMA